MSKTENLKVGKWGEEIALDYLKNNNYKILEKIFKCKIGEIDLIAKTNDIIVFVEVKTRSSDMFGHPREAVNYYKQKKIRSVALNYLKYKNLLNFSCRFDVIEILDGNITHLENCFWLKIIEYFGMHNHKIL